MKKKELPPSILEMGRAKLWTVFVICFSVALLMSSKAKAQQDFRPPAYPLITVDPYLSVWSMQDTLYGGPTQHWTEQEHPLQGIIRVDGEPYNFLGQPITRYNTLLSMADNTGEWQFKTSAPANGWQKIGLDDSQWETGTGEFTDGEDVPNPWNTREIWARRTFNIEDLGSIESENILLKIQHDDDVEVYINGVPAFEKVGVTFSETPVEISSKARRALKEGANTIAAHCTNTGGLALLDVGLVEEIEPDPEILTARQTDVHLTATQTKYSFEAGPVQLQTTFTAPLLPDDLEMMSRPANYLTFNVTSNDNQAHDVQLYMSAGSHLAVNTTDQEVVWQRMPSRRLEIMRVGTENQQVLGRKGDTCASIGATSIWHMPLIKRSAAGLRPASCRCWISSRMAH